MITHWLWLMGNLAGAQPLTSIPPEVNQAVEATSEASLPHRIASISQTMLGRPYALDPLGEGHQPDTDPPVRYDTYDCLTFVEEVFALSMGRSVADASRIRQILRYGDQPPSYTNRHHLMALQWLPSAQERGWLVDRTPSLGGSTSIQRDITLDTWRAWPQRSLFHHLDEELPVGQARLSVLPLDRAREVMQQIPEGSMILTIREDRAYRPVWVSHVGLVFQRDGNTVVRHATRLGDDVVKDHDLGWYLDHLKSYTHLPVAGIAIWELVQPETDPTSSQPAAD